MLNEESWLKMTVLRIAYENFMKFSHLFFFKTFARFFSATNDWLHLACFSLIFFSLDSYYRWISAYLCAKCKVLFDTITIYDEHLENCKNNPENYNFDEVLEKLRFVFTSNCYLFTGKMAQSTHFNIFIQYIYLQSTIHHTWNKGHCW